MPELPEVETIKNQLQQKIRNKTISKVEIVDYQKNFQGDPKNILGRIVEIKRRAKQLIFCLDNNYLFALHLKLTGQLVYSKKIPEKITKNTHVVFYFQDGSGLLFNDYRKFGFVKVMKTADLENYIKNQKLGPEPLELSFEQFQQLLQKKRKSRIKQTLMDQAFISGLGNIYAQEACYQAGILPIRTISSLSTKETERLYQAIKEILNSAIEYKGTSFDTIYVQLSGQPGRYDQFLKVYHQEACLKCKTKLKIVKLNGRSTYYCPGCQK